MGTSLFELIEQYREKGFSVIPVKGKMPLIKSWSDYCNKLPPMEMLKEWEKFTDPTGIGLCLGPASNICCIDCDTDDPEVIKLLQYSPVEKRGRKGFTRFYRINFPDVLNPWNPPQQILTIGKVEFFFGGKQTVIVGEHPDGKEFNYRWTTNQTLLNIDLDALPVFDPTNIEAVKKHYDPRNMPKARIESDEEDGHRYKDMMAFTSDLIRKKTTLDDAVDLLLAHDQERNHLNPYFLDSSKGFKTLSARINAGAFYAKMLESLNSKKTSIEELEVPKSTIEFSQGEWNEIEEFKEKEPLFTHDLIPAIWREWIIKNSANSSIAEAPMLFQAIAAISSLIGNKVSIKPKKANYTQAANIWVTCIAEPGSRKSAVSDLALYPLHQVNKFIIKEAKETSKASASAKESIYADIKILKRKITKMEKGNAPANEIKKELAQLNFLEKQIKNSTVPYYPIMQGMTPEKMMQVAESNVTGGLILHLEGSGLFDSMSKKGWEHLRPFLLQSWDGSRHDYQTKTAGGATTESLALSLIMAIQPTVYQKHVTRIINSFDDGLAQRSFLVYDVKKKYPPIDEEIDPMLAEEVTKTFFQAYNLTPGTTAKFDPDAYARYRKYEQELIELIENEKSPQLKTFWSKYSGLVVRVAYLYEFISSPVVPTTVSLKSLETAIKLLEFNTENVRLAFCESVISDAKLVISMFQNGIIKNGDTINSIYKARMMPPEINSLTKITAIINELKKRNMIKVEKHRNEKKVFINPKLLE